MGSIAWQVLTGFVLLGGVAMADEGLSSALPLAPGVPVERNVDRLPGASSAGGEHLYRFELAAGRRAALFVEQNRVDVRLEARWPGGEKPWILDTPLDYDGIELLLLPPEARGQVTLRVTTKAPGGPSADPEVLHYHPSRYQILLSVGREGSGSQGWLTTLAQLTTAGRAYAEGTGAGRRRALSLYGIVVDDAPDQAQNPTTPGSPWRRDLQDRLTAQALYAEAVLFRLLGDYRPALEHARAALLRWTAPEDRPRLADTWNEIGLVLGPDGDTTGARQAFETALALAEALEDPFRQAIVRGNLCLIDLMERRLQAGIGCFEAALPAARRIGDAEAESAYLVNIAQAHKVLGESPAALKRFREALEIQRALGLTKLEAKTLHNLGGLHRRRAELEAALEAYRGALARFEQLGDQRWRARTLHNLASTEARLGDFEAAAQRAQQALELHRRVGNVAGEASALKISGHLSASLGDWPTACAAYRRAQELEAATDDDHGEAVATAFLGRCELQSGNASIALEHLSRALGALATSDDTALVAAVRVIHGRALAALGRPAAARAGLAEALDAYDRFDDPHGRGWALFHLAELEAGAASSSGPRSHAVLGLLEESLAAFDAVTLELESSDLRALFAGAQRRARERYVSALLEADQKPAALAASEAARGWGLRSLLGSAPTSFSLATGIDLASVQRLLDDSTVLFEYLVGEDASHLFVVTTWSLEVFPLPPRAELEEIVRAARRELLSSTGSGESARWLSKRLIGDAAARLARAPQRIVLALDGPLHLLPFAALPAADGVLADRFELVRIPSAAVLALDRRRRAARPVAEGWAAVLADPIFSPDDLRLASGPSGADLVTTSRGQDRLPRLRFSRNEADFVTAAAGDEPTRIALDADANAHWLLDESLGDFRILHLATHAHVDDVVPARSGLELSLPAATDPGHGGFLGTADLRRLDLRAELVFLSACRTALGKEIRGEGLVGLTQAFFEAGGSRVIASLWPVADRSTAELVRHFYGAIAQGSAPAAALRQAQGVLRRDPRFARPESWAGFVMVGDWQDADLQPRPSSTTHRP
ncbi:MAG: CHAT domain-containing tetratricopeptide repeat protein [Acidobacteriota bacterium]